MINHIVCILEIRESSESRDCLYVTLTLTKGCCLCEPSGLPPTCVCQPPPPGLLRPPCTLPPSPCLPSLLAPMSLHHLASFSPRLPNSLLSERSLWPPRGGRRRRWSRRLGGGDSTSAQSRLRGGRRRGGGSLHLCGHTGPAAQCTATNSSPHLLTDSPPPYPVCTHFGYSSFGEAGKKLHLIWSKI